MTFDQRGQRVTGVQINAGGRVLDDRQVTDARGTIRFIAAVAFVRHMGIVDLRYSDEPFKLIATYADGRAIIIDTEDK